MPGRKLGPGLVEGDAALEAAVPGRAGSAAEVLDMAGERLAGEGNHRDRDLLSDGEVAAVELPDCGADLPVFQIGNLGDRHAGAGGIAQLERRQLHAPIHHVLVAVLLDVDVARGLGLERHAVDHAFGGFRHDLGLIEGCLLDGDAGGIGGLVVVEILLGLPGAVLRGFEREFVLLRLDGRDDGILAHLQLGDLHIGLGGEHLVLALFVGCLTGSLGLNHLLFGFGQIGLGLAEVVLLLGGIECDHDVAGLDQLSGIAQDR